MGSIFLKQSQIILNYERSSQGDGGVEAGVDFDENATDDNGKKCSHCALDQCLSSVNYNQSYLLHL